MADKAELTRERTIAGKKQGPGNAAGGKRHDALERRPQVRSEGNYGAMLNARPAVAAQRKAAERLAARSRHRGGGGKGPGHEAELVEATETAELPIQQNDREDQSAEGSSSVPVQMKKVIKGTHRVDGRGDLDVDFEERSQGKSAGVYGVIGFVPDGADTRVAEKIDLIQIASLRSNDQDNQEIETAGAPQVKDMWRVNGKFHMDLLGDQSAPRRSSNDPQIEEAYNSERRKWKPEERLDEAVMGNDDKVLNQYEVFNAQSQKKKLVNTRTRQIAQAPGFNKGDGNVRGTELFDYPKCSLPAIASFHTTVDADGKPWATVTWGFTSKKMDHDDDMELASVDGPTFLDGQSEEMKAARKNFNNIMANKSSWISPESLDDILLLLASRHGVDVEEGIDQMKWMAEGLETTINQILQASAPHEREKGKEKEARQTLRNFLEPHLEMLKRVLVEVKNLGFADSQWYGELVELHSRATARLT